MKSFFSKLSVLLFGVAFAVAGCQDYDEDIRKVNDQLNANTAELTSITDALDKAIKDLEAKMVADYATKKALADLSAELKAEIDADVAAAQAAIDAAYKAADAALKAGYESADAALKTELEGKIAAAIKAAQDANDALADTFEKALNQMKGSIDETNSMINDVVVPYFQGEIAKINTAIKALQDADVKTAQDIAKVAADLATAKTEITAAYTAAIKTAVEKLEGKIAEQATALAALKTLHQNDVILLQAAIAENSTDINALKLALKDHIADYKTTVEQLQGAFAEGDEEVKRILTNNLNAHIELYEQTVEDLQGAIGENTAEIELVRGLVRDLTALHTQDVADLQAAIADNTTLANSIKLDLKNHIADYTATVDLLQGAIGENAAAITANLLAINSLKTLHETDIQNLQDVIVILEAALNQETAQRKAADEELEAKLDTLAALHKTDIELLQAAYAEADEALRQQLTNRINALEDDYNATVEQIQNAMSELEARIFANEVGVRDLQAKAAELDQTIADLDAAYKAADEALRADIVDINKVLDQFANNFTSVQFQIDFIVAALEQTIADLNALEVNVGVLTERVQSLVYVPEYNDAKATINYGIAPYFTADQKADYAIVPAKSVLRYKVNSTSETAVDDIVAAFNQDPSILSYDLQGVEIRRSAPAATLEVASVANVGGYLEVTVLAKNFDKNFFWSYVTKETNSWLKDHLADKLLGDIFDRLFGENWGTITTVTPTPPTKSYSAALVLTQSEKKNDIASEFTNLLPATKYDVLGLAVKYAVNNDPVVVEAEFSNKVAAKEVAQHHYIPTRDTEAKVHTLASEAVIKVYGVDGYFTPEQLYDQKGYKVEIDKTHQVVAYKSNHKVDATDQSAPAWNTDMVSLSDTDPKFIVSDVTCEAHGTSRQVSLTGYEEEDEINYPNRVYGYLQVVDAYYFAGQSVAVADQINISKNLVYINFDAKTYDWTLAKAISLRGVDENKTAYAKPIVLEDVPYDNIYNLNSLLTDATATTTVKLNGANNAASFVLSDITGPVAGENGKAGTADITISGYEFAAAKAESDNNYVVTIKTVIDDKTDAIITIPVTLGKYPQDVTVESSVELYLVDGQNYFDGKDALVNDAYLMFAEFTGFAADAKVNDLMFAALTDGNNAVENVGTTVAENINFLVETNVDNSYVRLTEAQVKDKANVAAEYTFERNIKTWFGVPFKFIVKAHPHLPQIGLVRSTEYASDSTVEGVDYTVNLHARVIENKYTVVNSDLAYYLNVIGKDASTSQAVTFNVLDDAKSTIADSTVGLDVLETPVVNPVTGTITAYLDKDEAILTWKENGTRVKVKATLWAGAYPVDTKVVELIVVDPLTFQAVNPEDGERVAEKETTIYVYENFVLTSTAKDQNGKLAHPGNLIDKKEKTLQAAISEKAKTAYGVEITLKMLTVVERMPDGSEVLYDASKYSWNETTGVLTLHADDAAELINPIVAKIRVNYKHGVHAESDNCNYDPEQLTIEARFVQKKDE